MNHKEIIRLFGICMALLLCVGTFSGTSFFVLAGSIEKTGTQMLTDLAGREVTVPDPVTRVTCLHPIPTYMAWRLAPDKLVSIDMVSKGRAYLIPENQREKYLNLPVTGVFFKGLNEEQVVALDPDVVVSMTKDPNVEDEQEKLRIPVVTVNKDTIEAYEPSFRLMGKLLGNEKEGNELADYWNDVIDRVTKISSTIPENERLKVYYTGSTAVTTPGSATIMSSIVRDAGGIPYADAVTLDGQPTDEGKTVVVEDVLKWNPDVIIAQNTNVTADINADPVWKETNAMKNGRIYCVPKYEFPDGITSIIGLMWVAETLYPDKMQFDIASEARAFFEKFYKNTDLTDEQIAMKNG